MFCSTTLLKLQSDLLIHEESMIEQNACQVRKVQWPVDEIPIMSEGPNVPTWYGVCELYQAAFTSAIRTCRPIEVAPVTFGTQLLVIS